jgi:hypothetical protein
LSFSFLLVFVFLIVVILMNLLNGLAVSDTGLIMEKVVVHLTQKFQTKSFFADFSMFETPADSSSFSIFFVPN